MFTGKSGRKGFTLPEVMISAMLTAMIVPILAVVFLGANRSFTVYEAVNSLKKMNQETANRIYLRLGRSKRLFQNTADDITYRSALKLSPDSPVMTGSQLPTIKENGTLAQGTTDFDSTAFGNSLLLAYNEKTLQLDNIQEVSTSTNTVSVRIDIYKFAYYYLTTAGAPAILGQQTYKTVEWHSIPYAECSQIVNISSATKKSNVIVALKNSGISYCWASAVSSSTLAFSSFTISGTDGALTTAAGHQIQMEGSKVLTNVITGIMRGGYQYGVSPNQSTWGGSAKTVPKFAAASGTFPSGLEVGIVGGSAGRQVLVRTVLVAHGNYMATTGNEQLVIATARDIW